jgi:hypothetical protein
MKVCRWLDATLAVGDLHLSRGPGEIRGLCCFAIARFRGRPFLEQKAPTVREGLGKRERFSGRPILVPWAILPTPWWGSDRPG